MSRRAPLASFVYAALSCILAGCGNSATPPAAAKALQADCSIANARLPGGVCVRSFAPTPDRHREASLATHPMDPRQVLVTWSETHATGRRVYAAATRDSGRTWVVQTLMAPDAPPDGFAFDSIAAYGPDGTAYVLYGGHNENLPVFVLSMHRITLASSRDGGRTWQYSLVADRNRGDLPGAIVPDYMDLAVAPDTGHLYVAAQIGGAPDDGILFWRSTDQGRSWSPAQLVLRTHAHGVERFLPRVVAGRDGFVALSMNVLATAEGRLAGLVMHSRDEGRTWSATQRVHHSHATAADGAGVGFSGEQNTFLNDPLAVQPGPSGPVLTAVYGDGETLYAYRSMDGGTGWSGPQTLGRYPEGAGHVWLSAAPGHRGEMVALYRYGSWTPERYGVGLLRLRADATVDQLPLFDVQLDGTFEGGDEYGGISVAADGAIWAAWSDPRGRANERVSVARIVPR